MQKTVQVVIDIPKELAEKGHWYTDEEMWAVIKAAQNGTVLPKHGRLIDADSLIKQTTEQICEKCDRRRGMKDGKLTKRFVYEIGDAPCRACEIGDMHDYLDDAPTILEAWGNEE